MSDFKTITDFRKGKASKWQYQDPTYLSFVIMFDMNNHEHSPLFSGAAEAWYRNNLVEGNATTQKFYQQRLDALVNFKKALLTINNEMPWYWQSLAGLDKLQTYDPLNAYLGGDDAILTIECLESINLPISGLMHLYKKAVFDENKWNYILPANLRKFRMMIYVTEVRPIMNMTNVTGPNTPNTNENISGTMNRPFFFFNLNYCEFDIKTGVSIFSNLNKNPEMAAQSIGIKYESMKEIDARVLNGIIDLSSQTDKEVIAPIAEIDNNPESNLPQDDLGNVYGERDNTLTGRLKRKANELADRVKGDISRFGQEKKMELEQKARNIIRGAVPNFESIYQTSIRRLDEATDITANTRNIGANIRVNINENIYDSSGTIVNALDSAANVSLGNIYK